MHSVDASAVYNTCTREHLPQAPSNKSPPLLDAMAPSKKSATATAANTNNTTTTAVPEPVKPAVETPATEVTPVVPVVVAEEDLAAKLGDLVSKLTSALTAITAQVKEVSAALKVAQKEVGKLQKQKDVAVAAATAAVAGGAGRRNKRKVNNSSSSSENAVPRKPSGFAKPAALSTQLCDFLGVAHDTKLARTDVTRMITKYIKEHELYGKEDKRAILPDAKLQAVLTVPKDQKLTYFNLQAYIKHHFVKEATPATVSA